MDKVIEYIMSGQTKVTLSIFCREIQNGKILQEWNIYATECLKYL